LFDPHLIFLLLIDHLGNLLGSLIDMRLPLLPGCKQPIVIFRPVDAGPFEASFLGEGDERGYEFGSDL
jgi:hypothetical protein